MAFGVGGGRLGGFCHLPPNPLGTAWWMLKGKSKFSRFIHLMGVHLMGVHLMGVYLMSMHLIGVHLISLCLIALGGKCDPSLPLNLWALTGGTYF